jgi:hypothetical protein
MEGGVTTSMGLTTSCIVVHRLSDHYRQRSLTVESYTPTVTSKGTPRLSVGVRICPVAHDIHNVLLTGSLSQVSTQMVVACVN